MTPASHTEAVFNEDNNNHNNNDNNNSSITTSFPGFSWVGENPGNEVDIIRVWYYSKYAFRRDNQIMMVSCRFIRENESIKTELFSK